MKQIQKILFVGMMVLALLIGFQSLSQATPLLLYLNDGVNPAIFVNDGGVGDINPVDGAVTFSGPIGNWTVNVTTGITYPALGSTSIPKLDLNSVNVSNASGGIILIGVSAYGYTFAPTIATLSIGGTTEGNVAYAQAWSGPNNVFFTNANPIGGFLSFTSSPFSGSVSGAIPASPNPYSLNLSTLIFQEDAGATSFNASLNAVPEPATMLLLGSGLIGLAGYARRRFRKN